MLYLESPSTNPHFNLALEEYVFEKLDPGQDYFMLWQNDNAVIVGKYQNSAREVDMRAVEERGIRVVRRLSGGGAVYHDMGNLNFTIITAAKQAEKLNFGFFATPLIATLAQFGVKAQATGRNDITVEGAKFSGNAQYSKRGRIMHHGTILYNSDLSVLGKVLRPRPDKFADKAVQSVRSRVTNLKPYLGEVSLVELKKAFAAQMDKENGLSPRTLTEADLAAAREIAAARYDTWDWNFGKSPDYLAEKCRRFEGVGEIELHFTAEDGRISSFTTYGDYFGEGAGDELQTRVVGAKAQHAALLQALEGLNLDRYYHGLTKEDFVKLFCE